MSAAKNRATVQVMYADGTRMRYDLAPDCNPADVENWLLEVLGRVRLINQMAAVRPDWQPATKRVPR